MWRLVDLTKGSFVNINKELYVIASKSSILPTPTSKELELTLELMKVGEKESAPNFRLIYIEKSESLRFEALDRKTNTWREHKIEKFGF